MSKIPGVVRSSLLVALPLLAVWLGDSFPAAQWAAPVAGLLLIIAKVVEAIRASEGAALPPGVAADFAPAHAKPNVWWG